MAIRANALAVMAKAPVAGQVKTRLLPSFTAEEAAELSRSLLVDQLSNLRALDTADFYLAFAPDDAQLVMEKLAPPCFHLFPQQGDDLGARMASVFERLFRMGHKNIALIGGDLPPVPLGFFDQTYAFLESLKKRVVLGPSRDGGYYLVGCNQLTPEIFQAMRWSHSEVLTETQNKLASLKVDYHLLPLWFDIDTADDLRHLESVSDNALKKAMPNTLLVLRRLGLKKMPGVVN
ncbi:MAG TPA: TIGR04282 family arsenosugar biosynthesis glycosyltransferase [Candidatus Binatia bacterium]|nr:TIGR04282 family arsenosugar biosynthesis glycosyltransferase [Candidatus Binatia bacterium]